MIASNFEENMSDVEYFKLLMNKEPLETILTPTPTPLSPTQKTPPPTPSAT